jgi:undecaprenyl-diphosphatase
MEALIGLILGIIEGLTEFAPVSSTGHMILISHLLKIDHDSKIKTFEVVVQLGAILAVLVIFWRKLIPVFTKNINFCNRNFHHRFNWLHILVGMIPAGIVGSIFYHFIKSYLFNYSGVLISLVLGGVLLIVADLFKPYHETASTLDDITYKQAFIVGVFQVLALWPGFSRSGSTISGGVLNGMSYRAASEYTFILALPIMIAAAGKDIYDNWTILSSNDLPLFVTGLIAAFITSLIVIKYFLKLITRIKLIPFAIYRFVIAILFIYYLSI